MQSKSQSAAILSFLADGPKPLREVLKQGSGPVGSIRNRMSELRVNGLIQDTVTLTDEGKAVLEEFLRKHQK